MAEGGAASARGTCGVLRALAGAAGVVLLAALLAEGLLRVASLAARDRGGQWRPDAAVRVLCVGDSHTYGLDVAEDESYPAQLQALLDARAPGHYSVVNLGIPGLSSTQLRERLPVDVSRYAPDLVLVWVGSNNAWSRQPAPADAPWRARLAGLSQHSRLLRLLRVWWHDRGLERAVAETRHDGSHQRSAVDLRVEGRQDWTFQHGGIVETHRNERAPARADDAMQERAHRDYRAIASYLRAAGVPAVLIRYPLEAGPYARANRAMERAGSELGIPVVDSPAALARIPEDERTWVSGRHPSAATYGQIARELVPLVEAQAS